MGAVDRHLDKTQDGRVQRLIQIGDRLAHTVGSHRVLNQVVGADGEEVGIFGQLIGENRSCRDFDHTADFDIVRNLDAFGDQFGSCLVIAFLGVLEFLNGGDHREHDAELAVDAGTEKSSQLGAEDILADQTESDGTDAEERVHLLCELIVVELLVTADIQCADDDRLAVEAFENLLVCGELGVFIGEVILALHIQEFGTEETYALTAVFINAFDILRAADVSDQEYLVAIGGNGRFIPERLQRFLFLQILLAHRGIFCLLLFGRVQNDIAVDRIEDDLIPCLGGIENALDADDCRNLEGSCHDGAVAGTAADFGSEALGEFLVQGSGITRGEILGNDDYRGIEGCEIGNDLAAEVAFKTESNILDVRGALFHIGVFHGLKDGNHHVCDLLGGIFRIDQVIHDRFFDLAAEFGITCHHQMGVEYCQFFGRERFGSDFLDLFDILNGLCKCGIQLCQFNHRIGFPHLNVEYRLFEFVNLCDCDTL